ncbi:lipid droplet-associated hydrolase-like [Macrosteles quadrilineatus]|uniref:lipid droplet-associated hydrolase-like n=1 Tax=Macrosteles quadrilineatus TaxID=74068 RepID=UPI0023E15FC1|nr:lipid droplet-associated hydrolase-like [Macrosteles quadrilineatus]XP_054262127.1 lipid droplet-associated hydrolase-like [Macrosteles quadrilineatus]
MTYREGWIDVNQVPTRVQTWGGWIEDSLGESSGSDIIIFIPGNPGITSFYHNFLSSLHQELGVPVWIACHTGHEVPPKSSKLKFPQDPNLYDMSGQVAHKLSFIKSFAPANRKLILIGHSLGAKIVSELLKDEQVAKNVKKCFLLMPTLERIAQTPNGKFLSRLLAYFMSVILFLAWVFSHFSHKCRVFLISGWFYLTRQHNVDSHCMDAVCILTLPSVLRRVFNLALDEMEKILELDIEVLNSNWRKMHVYFARKDGWAPLSYMDSLKQAFPDINAKVLGEQFRHVFVLDNPEEMADLLASQMKTDIKSS